MLRRRPMLYALAAVAVAVLGLFAVVAWIQSTKIYGFDTTASTPAAAGLPTVRVARFRSEDGHEVAAWIAPPAAGKPMLLSFHGNFASVAGSAARLAPLLEQGNGLAMLVYRGSSGEGGVPSEANFAADARALYDQLDALLGVAVPPDRRVLHGFSLGSSVAAGLAKERAAAGLVLEATFDRCCRYYAQRFHLPMCWLMWRERHDVVDKLVGVTVPKLFLHGAKDQAVPEAWARDLFAACVGEKLFVSYANGDHADLMQHGALDEMAKWMTARMR
jgi:fermentation-respiration switch protein FrsA (DUF1100 family)